MPTTSYGWPGAIQPRANFNYQHAVGLMSYWSLDETESAAADRKGRTNLYEASGTVGAAVGGGRDFEAADTAQLEAATNPYISAGNIDFTFAAWVKAETLSNFPVVAHKGWRGTPDADSEWVLYYDTSASRWTFNVRGSSTTGAVVANNAGAASTGTLYFLVCRHDSVNDQISISVNGGTPDTASHTVGVNNGTGLFQMGASSTQSLYWDGVIDEAAFWKRFVTTGQITDLYNSGTPRDYTYITRSGGWPGAIQPQDTVVGSGGMPSAGLVSVGGPHLNSRVMSIGGRR